MISVILAAGSGTRLRPLSYFVPKILLPVKGKPVLDYILNNMKGLDIDTHYIVASEQRSIIQNYIERMGMDNIRVVRGLGWETGGDLSIALEQIQESDDVIVTNGDIVTDINLERLYKFHKSTDAYVTMSVFELFDREEAKRFGRIELNGGGLVVRFTEKPPEINRIPAIVNTGFYVFDRKIIDMRMDYLVPRKFKLETELFPRLTREMRLYSHITELNYWWDVGTISSYLKAEQFLINERGIIPP